MDTFVAKTLKGRMRAKGRAEKGALRTAGWVQKALGCSEGAPWLSVLT